MSFPRWLLWLLGLTAALVITGVFALRLPAFGGSFEGERLTRMQASPAYHAGRLPAKARSSTSV